MVRFWSWASTIELFGTFQGGKYILVGTLMILCMGISNEFFPRSKRKTTSKMNLTLRWIDLRKKTGLTMICSPNSMRRLKGKMNFFTYIHIEDVIKVAFMFTNGEF
jgi:hypothetical protein